MKTNSDKLDNVFIRPPFLFLAVSHEMMEVIMASEEKEKGFLRANQIYGDRKKGIPAIIPISRSSWFAGVKSKKYPQSIKLSERIVVWRMSDIQKLIDKMAK